MGPNPEPFHSGVCRSARSKQINCRLAHPPNYSVDSGLVQATLLHQLPLRLLPCPYSPHHAALSEHRENTARSRARVILLIRGGGSGNPFTVRTRMAISATPSGSPASRSTPSASRVISLWTRWGWASVSAAATVAPAQGRGSPPLSLRVGCAGAPASFPGGRCSRCTAHEPDGGERGRGLASQSQFGRIAATHLPYSGAAPI